MIWASFRTHIFIMVITYNYMYIWWSLLTVAVVARAENMVDPFVKQHFIYYTYCSCGEVYYISIWYNNNILTSDDWLPTNFEILRSTVRFLLFYFTYPIYHNMITSSYKQASAACCKKDASYILYITYIILYTQAPGLNIIVQN